MRPEGSGDEEPFDCVWAAGDHLNDLGLLRAADRAFIVEPKSPRLRHLHGVFEFGDYDELTEAMERERWLQDDAGATPRSKHAAA